MKLHCYICGKSINAEENKGPKLDPCEVKIESNCNEDPLDRKSQTFWCHFNCFKNRMEDSRFIELEHGVATEREIIEENKSITDRLEHISEQLNAEPVHLEKLFLKEKGVWYRLRDLIPEENASFIKEIYLAEKDVYRDFIVQQALDEIKNLSFYRN